MDETRDELNPDTLQHYARQGVRDHVVNVLKEQRRIERLFPGVTDEAELQIKRDRAAHARACRQQRRER